MMIIILLGVALAIGVYFYMQKSKTKTKEPIEKVVESFIPSDTFVGAKKVITGALYTCVKKGGECSSGYTKKYR